MNESDKLPDLRAFLAVYEESSFTRAAARMGVSQSALSQTIRTFEERLGIRLFSRTTRSVSPTEAGERLVDLIGPAMQAIVAGLEQVSTLRDKPAGTIRLTADEYAVQSVLLPAIARFLPDYPDIRVEITTEQGLTDIVSDRYDAGVRRGGLVARDMIAVRIGPDVGMAVVGAPAYFAGRPPLRQPKDLTGHACIHLRLPTHGGVFTWTFSKGKRAQRIKVDGQLVFNSLAPILDAALAGLGLAWLPEEMVQPHVDAGRLVQVLQDWRQTFEGYHLYYPHRRQQSPAFGLLVETLRYRG